MAALHAAVTPGYAKIVDELLYAGAVVDTLYSDSNPASDITIRKQLKNIFKLAIPLYR